MITHLIDDVSVTAPESMGRGELMKYVEYQKKKYPTLYQLEVQLDGEFVNLTAQTRVRPFERIRRITGYLVGNMSHWNNAKRAEEADRVKHTI